MSKIIKFNNKNLKKDFLLIIFLILNILILIQSSFFSRLHNKVYMSMPEKSIPCERHGIQGYCMTSSYTDQEKKLYDNNIDIFLFISKGLLICEVVFCIYSCIQKRTIKLCFLEIVLILLSIFIFMNIGLYNSIIPN